MTRSEQAPSGEDSLIARYFKPLATDPGAFNLGDDAAILNASGEDTVVTTDAIVEGVHFLADDPPDTVARKALRVNLSDLAAKGATPAGFVLTLALRAARRRYGFDARSADDLDHGVRASARRRDGPSQRRKTRRPHRGDGDDRRRRPRPRYPQGRRGRGSY